MYELPAIMSLMIPVVIVGAIIYAIFRPKDHNTGVSNRDALFYVLMFLALIPLFWGTADLGRIILENLWKDPVMNISTQYGNQGVAPMLYRAPIMAPRQDVNLTDNLRQVSLRISAIVVALPLFVWAWLKVTRRRSEERDLASQRSYATAVLVISSPVLIIMGVWVVYQLLNALLGVAETTVREQLIYLLPYSSVLAVVWLTHYLMRSSTDKENKLGELKVEELKK